MFIVCPSCSGPYRIPAEQIAPLVQTACPHCEYRIILDFEAANEPSLREAGHQFAQGFESVEAYASVYDHVTSKPDAQPRAGVTAVTVQSSAQSAVGGTRAPAQTPAHTPAHTPAATPVAAATPVRPQRRSLPGPGAPAAAPRQHPCPGCQHFGGTPASTPAAATSVRSAGSKTMLQVPSKKPVSMDASPVAATPTPVAATTAGPSMRAGKGVDVVEPGDPAKVEPRSAEPSQPNDRKPPHTPPVASVVSSGPPPSEQPTPPPEDIAAQSGPHPAKVETKPAETKPAETKPAETKPAVKPPEPGSPSVIYVIIVTLLVAAVVAPPPPRPPPRVLGNRAATLATPDKHDKHEARRVLGHRRAS
ncbi:hypothetical protein [Nannocystis sp.]|uniref:hypothetical protein n=1 Tax=Nannocystis sp. TaxID=1962667 RepID=UPI0025D6A76C|nr:hypothetical protein [Nannocystis sp.]